MSHWLTGRREPYKGSAALNSLPVLDDSILPSRAASVSPERVHHPHRAAKHRSHATASADVAHAHKRSIGRLRAPVERTTSEAERATWTQPRPFLKMPEQNGTVAASPLCDAQSSMPCHAEPCGAMPGHAARRCPMVVTQFCQRWAGPQGKPFLLHCLALCCGRTAKLAAPQHTVCLTKAVLRCTGFGFAAEGTL